ncbi:hypothetical protein SAMN05518672_11239 [Chitinophaga sp. CF118]|uniref:hypothetical protein n=1 Tax=Chitinophaga sp. CF118 TaxID=1884367 RepID=UPI0008F0B819|nr:hypothetical protein [Chitinophaga sp. CF118]SFE91578.1 hypothetical protein SAMN05518672_11239 [Chitinophaga sp. CF118]
MAKERSAAAIITHFQRKGGEGEFTKIITERNEPEYAEQLAGLEDGEKGLIIYKKDNTQWVLLTSKRIISVKNESRSDVYYQDLAHVEVAMDEEYENLKQEGFRSFTRLKLTDINRNTYVFQVEAGSPFNGISQVMHFINRY